jgi:hypothetical protein
MQGINRKRAIARVAMAALLALAIGATTAQAYDMYDDPTNLIDDNCASCHPDFKSVGPLHGSHLLNLDIKATPQITNRCNVCHTNGGGTKPVFTMGSNTAGMVGYGCTGCHGRDYGENATTAPFAGDPKSSGYGMRAVHAAAGVVVCAGCHAPWGGAPLDESVRPPYYPLHVSELWDPCDSVTEDLPFDVDTTGLDNDGNGLRDYPADPACPTPPTSTTTSTTTTTTSTTLPITCGASPLGVCTAAEKAKLTISEKKAGKEKVKFQLTKLLPALVQSAFGSPVASDTSYALCVYDATNALVGSYEVARGGDTCGTKPCWKDFKGIGYQYTDKAQTADGINKMLLAGGDAGKGKAKVQGSNKASTLPTGVTAMLAGDTSATAQLLVSDGQCYGMALPTVKKNDGLEFQASNP